MTIQTVTDKKRGCGWRSCGLYLRCDDQGWACGALPMPLLVCPVCSTGIKPSRAWTWINLATFAAQRDCKKTDCGTCPLADAQIQKCGLIWIGAEYYKTTNDFTREAQQMGISRRIPAVPREFKLGETWVALAHRKAIVEAKFGQEPKYKAGIFHVFQPTRVEYVIGGDEDDKKLEALEKRGITLVKVVREKQSEMKVESR